MRSQTGSGVPRSTMTDVDVWLRGERIEIVEIGDMRQERHRDSDLAVAALSAAVSTRS